MKTYYVILGLCAVLTACGNDTTESSAWCSGETGPSDEVRSGGEVLAHVCYGATSSPQAIHVADESDGTAVNLDFPQTRNNDVVVFDESSNDHPIVGDVLIDGNKITIYGNGAEHTIIDGNVTIAGNNARLRGLTITGNLLINLNNAAIVDCVVHGNVVITKNNTLLASTIVYGNVGSTSNNNVFAGDHVQGAWSIGGHNARCEDDVAFTDEDQDFVIDDEEVGDALTC